MCCYNSYCIFSIDALTNHYPINLGIVSLTFLATILNYLSSRTLMFVIYGSLFFSFCNYLVVSTFKYSSSFVKTYSSSASIQLCIRALVLSLSLISNCEITSSISGIMLGNLLNLFLSICFA